MSEVKRKQKLPCTTCGKFVFTTIVEVEHHPNGGISDTPAGKMCAHCGTVLNTRASWAKLEIEEQMRKIKELREMGELELEGLMADSMKSSSEAGVGLESLLKTAQEGRKPRLREETELGKILDSSTDET